MVYMAAQGKPSGSFSYLTERRNRTGLRPSSNPTLLPRAPNPTHLAPPQPSLKGRENRFQFFNTSTPREHDKMTTPTVTSTPRDWGSADHKMAILSRVARAKSNLLQAQFCRTPRTSPPISARASPNSRRHSAASAGSVKDLSQPKTPPGSASLCAGNTMNSLTPTSASSHGNSIRSQLFNKMTSHGNSIRSQLFNKMTSTHSQPVVHNSDRSATVRPNTLGSMTAKTLDLGFGENDDLCGAYGTTTLGDDALMITKGEVLMGPDNKPVRTPQGGLVSVRDLTFSNSGILYSPGMRPVLERSGSRALTHDNILLGSDGYPRFDSEGRVIEMKDVMHAFQLDREATLSRTDLYFTSDNVLMGRGAVILGSDGLPATKGEVLVGNDGKPLLCEGGHVVTEGDLSISNDGRIVAMGNRRILGLDEQSAKWAKCGKLLLRADGHPKLSSDGKLMQREEILMKSNGQPILGKDQHPVARTDLKFSQEGVLVDSHGKHIIGADGLLITRGEI